MVWWVCLCLRACVCVCAATHNASSACGPPPSMRPRVRREVVLVVSRQHTGTYVRACVRACVRCWVVLCGVCWQVIPEDESPSTWKRRVHTALEWLDKLPPATEVKMACEVGESQLRGG